MDSGGIGIVVSTGDKAGSGKGGRLWSAEPLGTASSNAFELKAGRVRLVSCSRPFGTPPWTLVDGRLRRATTGVDTALDNKFGRTGLDAASGLPATDGSATPSSSSTIAEPSSASILSALGLPLEPPTVSALPPRTLSARPCMSFAGDVGRGEIPSWVGDAVRKGSDVGDEVSSSIFAGDSFNAFSVVGEPNLPMVRLRFPSFVSSVCKDSFASTAPSSSATPFPFVATE